MIKINGIFFKEHLVPRKLKQKLEKENPILSKNKLEDFGDKKESGQFSTEKAFNHL